MHTLVHCNEFTVKQHKKEQLLVKKISLKINYWQGWACKMGRNKAGRKTQDTTVLQKIVVKKNYETTFVSQSGIHVHKQINKWINKYKSPTVNRHTVACNMVGSVTGKGQARDILGPARKLPPSLPPPSCDAHA